MKRILTVVGMLCGLIGFGLCAEEAEPPPAEVPEAVPADPPVDPPAPPPQVLPVQGRPIPLPPPRPGAGVGAGTLRIKLPPQVDLARLADLVAAFAHVSLQYDPQRLRGMVKLAVEQELSGAELWKVFNQVLQSQGFTTVVAGQPAIYQVVPLAEAANVALVLSPEARRSLSFQPGYAVVMFELRHLGAEAALKAVSQLQGGGRAGKAHTLGDDPHRLVVGGLIEKIAETELVLSLLDRDGVAPVVRTYRPQRAAPAALQAGLVAAWNAVDRISSGRRPADVQVTPDGSGLLLITGNENIAELERLVGELDRSEPEETRSYRPRFFAIADVARLLEQVLGGGRTGQPGRSLAIVQDDLTNALIITATSAQHQRITEMLQSLDDAPPEARRQVRSFVIRNRSVDDLAQVLTGMVQSGLLQGRLMAQGEPPAAEAAPTTPAAPAPAATPPPAASRPAQAITSPGEQNQDLSLVLTTDKVTNTLIALGEPRVLAQLEKLLAELDVRLPQVELEVTMVSLSDSTARDVGVELVQMFSHGETSVALSSLFGLSSVVAGADAAARAATGTGATGLVLHPGDFAGVIRALETVNQGRSLVRAKVVVNNNAEASLQGVVQEPFSSINSSNTVATTSFGGTSDAGTQVKVTPQIAAGDHVTLVYSIVQSAFTGAASAQGLPPPKRSDTVASTATVPDSFVIAVGGLSNLSQGLSETRLPILGAIPVLGRLFKTETRRKSDDRFYVFIKANILRHQRFEDLRQSSEAPRQAAGVADDGWPKLEPKLMD